MTKKRFLLFLLLAVAAVCLSACVFILWVLFAPPSLRTTDYVLDRPIPDKDIVFLERENGNVLGFINADGSGLEYVRLWHSDDGEEARIPTVSWSGDGKFFLWPLDHIPDSPLVYRVEGTKLIGYNPTRSKIWHGEVTVRPGANQAVTSGWYRVSAEETFWGIFLLDLTDMNKPPVVLVSTHNEGKNWWEFFKIGPNPICGNLLVFLAYEYHDATEDFFKNERLIFYDLSNGTQTTINNPTAGIPSCSPDGKWIGYPGEDGIYLVRPDGSGVRKVETSPSGPISWSPDGKWIVYHACLQLGSCDDFQSYGIFKLNIETGEKVKLVDGGMYPYWRWPAEQTGE